ncbi:hypothetical protein Q5X66_13510 [Acinetobacter baumannii]|nr:hypothetical protein [Acinetobacter baumannii]
MSLNQQPLFVLDSILGDYAELEKKYKFSYDDNRFEATPVNFKLSKTVARHRWFTYKEGFSPIFIQEFIKNYNIKNNNCVIFDPFGGIGTTVLESSNMGYLAMSNDVNPLSNYIARIKTENYSENFLTQLLKERQEFINSELIESLDPPKNDTVIKYFNPQTLQALLKIQYWIMNRKEEKVKNIFNLIFLTSLESLSTHRKDGNGVKLKKNFQSLVNIEEIKQLFLDRLEIIIEDLKNTPNPKISPIISYQSSFEKYELPVKVDLVITSPPYANCFDYSKIYLVELWMGSFFKTKEDQQIFRESSVQSHVHYTWKRDQSSFDNQLIEKIMDYLDEQKLWNKKIPSMLNGYFFDLKKVLKELINHLNKGAVLGFVVGNSMYAGLPIATDLILANIAEELGYSVKEIKIYRKLTASSQQMKKLGNNGQQYLRESLVVLEWN